MPDTKTKLQDIKEKATNPNLSLAEIAKLWDELQKVFSSLPPDKIKKEERKLLEEVNKLIEVAVYNSIDKWEKGEINPQKDELIFLSEYFYIFLQIEANQAAFEKSINENKKIDADEKQRNIESLRKSLKKFKNYRPKLEMLFSKEQKKNSSTEEKNLDNSSGTSSEEGEAFSRSVSTNTDQKNKKGFSAWWIILIIFGLLIVAGVIGYFILEKKERSPKPKKPKTNKP